jgi:acyl carrier protein
MKNYIEIENFILNFIKKSIGDHEINTTMSFMDYGLDSMTIAALAGDITDKFGLMVDPVKLYEYPSIQSVCEYLYES